MTGKHILQCPYGHERIDNDVTGICTECGNAMTEVKKPEKKPVKTEEKKDGLN